MPHALCNQKKARDILRDYGCGKRPYIFPRLPPDDAGLFARSITETGCLRILPSAYEDIGGVDGFFRKVNRL
ncbi:MAG: hypothetical protein CM15mP46_1980 [Alphaproteobacteria bacterium]|nr:MAG: hypothetical protein CM15mP46_1980 [Alphaproteobacteria bacterium]